MNAKRGFVPEDEKNFSPAALETLRTAVGHIDYLINNGYDLKQSSVFVGNHFLLSKRQRLAIIIRMMLDALREMHAGSAHILLDEPVSNSGRLKTLLAEIGEKELLTLDIRIMRDVDRALWEKENVISSDSIILDHCKSWVNLMASCAEKQDVQPLRVWSASV